MSWLYLFSCWLHVMAAIAWLGTAVFLVVGVVPALRNPELRPQAGKLMRAMAQPLRWLGLGALVVFLITGTYNLHVRFGAALHDGAFWRTGVGQVVAGKLALFGVIVAVATIHDLWLGPKAAVAGVASPDSEGTMRLRRWARICGRANLLFGLVMVFFGILIVRPGW